MAKNSYLDTSSYFRVIDNPDVSDFLSECDYLIEPNGAQINDIVDYFEMVADYTEDVLPENIIAIDSDMYESAVRKELPYTNLGYVKITSSLLQRTKYKSMSNSHFIDPFNLAKITKDKEEIMAVLPCSNMAYKGEKSARDSFRLALEEFFEKVCSTTSDGNLSLKDTLFWLNSYRTNNNKDTIVLHKCVNCGQEKIEILNINERQRCPFCKSNIYATDVLRIYETVEEDTISNKSALGRLRVSLKHIFLAHLLRTIKVSNKDTYLDIFSNLAFVINGTLSIAGQPAWIHNSMMKIIYEINTELQINKKKNLVILGIVDDDSNTKIFANMISRHLDKKSLMCISDDFRDKYINYPKMPSSTTFGAETYYGQDFIYKSKKGKMFVFDIPYPFADKSNISVFKVEKSKMQNYDMLSTVLSIIDELDCDLSNGKIVPGILSEKYTAINMEPGATVLDILAKIHIG